MPGSSPLSTRPWKSSEWEEIRTNLQDKKRKENNTLVDGSTRDISYLLGGWSGEPKDGDDAMWKLASEMVMATNLILQLLPVGSKIRGRGEQKAMMSNRSQNEKAAKGLKEQKRPTHILHHLPTNQQASSSPRRYRRYMAIDNQNFTHGSEWPLHLHQ